jgi:hypothetical protein
MIMFARLNVKHIIIMVQCSQYFFAHHDLMKTCSSEVVFAPKMPLELKSA